MRRRLTIVIVATVIGAVAVVGLGTLALTRIDARRRNADQLDDRARALAAVVAEVRPARAALTARALQRSLGVDEIQVTQIAKAPEWVGPAGQAELRAGQIVTDRQG